MGQNKFADIAVVNAYFPREGFGVGVLFDDRRFERQFRRVNRLPIVTSGECPWAERQRQTDDAQQ